MQGKWTGVYLQRDCHWGEGSPLPCPSSFHRSESVIFLRQEETLPLVGSLMDLSFVTKKLFWDKISPFFPCPKHGWGTPVILRTALAPCSPSHRGHGVMEMAQTRGKSWWHLWARLGAHAKQPSRALKPGATSPCSYKDHREGSVVFCRDGDGTWPSHGDVAFVLLGNLPSG